MRPYVAQIQSSLRLLFRDRAVWVFSMLFPLVFFFVFAQAFGASQSPGVMSQVIARVMIIGVLGSGFFGAGMRTVLDRETNVLRRFKVAPINAGPIIVSSMVAGWVAYIPTVCLFLILSKVIYHAPLPPRLLSLFFFTTIGLLAFRAVGMIIGSVVNSQQEATVLIQLLYLPMLFLSGATFPLEMMPKWLLTIANFLPATYLFLGMQSILLGGESALSRANLLAALALLLAMCVALFVGIKLFRWEKEEKISGKAKAWILAVLAPFVAIGLYQAHSLETIERARTMDRQASRTRTVLFNNVNIFVGNGETIRGGAVLIKDGKIAKVFKEPPRDVKALNAETIEEAGKTLLPGLIDMHVHIGAPGGIFENPRAYGDPKAPLERLAAYLYSGITMVRSVGDLLNGAIELRKAASDEKNEVAGFYTCGPVFTAEGGHPEEFIEQFPSTLRTMAKEQFLREPKAADEARREVDDLKLGGVDCIKAVEDEGYPGWRKFNRLDPAIYRAVVAEAAQQGLWMATHTGKADDVKLAVDAGTNSIEHGSTLDLIPAETFAAMKAKGIVYDPTLSIFEALAAMASGRTDLLDRPLAQQVGPPELLRYTKKMLSKPQENGGAERLEHGFQTAEQNLRAAHQAGVTLISGSDAGNMMVIHGPTVQRELELWVGAKIPAAVALQAATYNAAKALQQENHIGLIREGMDATLLIVDGDPLTDIGAMEHINAVYLGGEHIERGDLFNQFKK